nr:hypothetical protein [Streptomyces olivaceus]
MRSKRQLMDGIRRRTRAGAPWRDVPESHRPRSRCRWSARPGSARTRPDKVRADKAYGSRANRAYRAGRGRQRVAVTNTFETPPLGAVTGPRIFTTRRAGEGQGTRPVAGIRCPAAGRVRCWDA